MASLFISRELKKRYVVVFRELFARDSDFTYNKEDITQSNVFINSRYHDLKIENPVPQILVTTASYSGTQETLFKNFNREILATALTKQSQKEYIKTVFFNLGIEVLSSNKAEGEILADKVFNFLDHEYLGLWEMPDVGVHMQTITVGETSPRTQYPQYSFITPIAIQGTFVMKWVIGVPEESIEDKKVSLFKNITVVLATEDDI